MRNTLESFGLRELAYTDKAELVSTEEIEGLAQDTTPLDSPTPATMSEQQERPMMKYFTPIVDKLPSCIVLPAHTATRFNLKSTNINMMTKFFGDPKESAYSHIDKSLQICGH